MPATILFFEPRHAARVPESTEPRPVPLSPPAEFRPRPTSTQIAHRWAMLSHLSLSRRRSAARPADGLSPDFVR